MATISGTDGSEYLGPFSTGDVYDAKGGDDTINPGTHPAVDGPPYDVVYGGDGTDLLVVDASAETQAMNLFLSGNPRFYVRSASFNFYINAYNDVEKISFTGGSGNDTIDTGSYGVLVNGNGGTDFWTSNLSAVNSDIYFELGTTTSIAAAGLTSILGIERISMTTGSGNDTIIGGSQADFMSTGAGDDLIDAKTRPSAGSDYDVVHGGDGDDTLVVDASAETQAMDLFLSGNPRFYVRSGSDNFYINAYNDVEKISFTGGSGNDTIDTGSYGILVHGGAGTDFWTSNLSALTSNVYYDIATTTSIAAAGLTSISGIERISMTTGSGNDTIVGGSEGDFISTGAGDDLINAKSRQPGSDYDVVHGGDGVDALVVNASAETESVTLSLSGNPRFYVRSASDNFYINAYNDIEKISITGGSGNDTFDTGSYGVAVRGGAGMDYWICNLSALTSDVTYDIASTSSIAAAGLNVINGIERISMTTGSGNDTITGGSQGDYIDTGAGNDLIDAGSRPATGSAFDVVHGGDGDDTLVVDASSETQSVQLTLSGNPRFFLRSDSDNFYLNAYNDVEKIRFTGGSGNDRIDTGSFGEVVRGGGGTDHWSANLSAVASGIFYNMAHTHAIAAAGLNAIYGIEGITLTTGGGNDTIVSGSQADTISTGDGNDMIDAGSRPSAEGSGIDVVYAGDGNDTLVVDASAETQGVSLTASGSPSFYVRSESGNFYVNAYDVEAVKFTGGSGGDTITGDDSNDRLTGKGGADSIVGAGGNDTLNGGGGNDTLNGDDGNDRLFGGFGNDTLHGYAGNDVLNGGGGNDVLVGAGGRDTLYGRAGADRLDGGGGNDVLNGNGGNDTLNGRTGADKLFGGGNNDVLNGNGGNDTLNGQTGADRLNGGGGNDVLNGKGGGDTLIGHTGDDRLNGGGGNDALDGSGGNDTLNGQNGADTLNGYGGNDLLNGGGGNDRFEFADGFGHDTITGFSAANLEKIDFSAVTGIVGFPDLVNHHLQADADGFALIVVGSNSLLLDGVLANEVGSGLDYSGQDFLF